MNLSHPNAACAGPDTGRVALLAVMAALVVLVAVGVALWLRQSTPPVDVADASVGSGESESGSSGAPAPAPVVFEPAREKVLEEEPTPQVVAEEPTTPEEPSFDEEAFWAAHLDRRMAKFLQDPTNVRHADSLLTAVIKASLSLQGRFIEEQEGVPTQLPRSSEDETWISSSGPFGHRLFIVSRFEFPEKFEVKAVQNRKRSERGEFLSPQRIDEDLSDRILALATRVRDQLPKP